MLVKMVKEKDFKNLEIDHRYKNFSEIATDWVTGGSEKQKFSDLMYSRKYIYILQIIQKG